MIKKLISLPLKIIFGLIIFCLLISYLSPFTHPENIWWVAFFGLGYSFLFFASIIVIIVCFWLKWKIKWVYVFLFLVGIPIHLRFFALGNNTEITDEIKANSVSIMSYNVRLFDVYNWLNESEKYKSRDRILAYIKDESPDILCLQEFYNDRRKNPYVTIEQVAETASYEYNHQHLVLQAKKSDFGIIIFSKYPIIKRGSVYGANHANQFSIFADIVKNKDTFRVYNIHLQSVQFQKEDYQIFSDTSQFGESKTSSFYSLINKVKKAYPPRAKQAQKIIEHLKQSPYPVIVCGDFNDTPISYVYNLFNRQLYDSFRKAGFGLGRTYAGKIPAGRIDYIFHDEELKSYSFNIQKETLSDHFAVISRIGKDLTKN